VTDTSRVPKWCKTIVGLLLLPACVGAVLALGRVFRESQAAETTWVVTISGAACWIVIYLLLPKPMWVYVFGHELTHALWTWLFGGKVKGFKASASGGHVVVTKSNFLIALAPYFFPVYAVLVFLLFAAGNWAWNWHPYVVWFHLLVGMAYAFHVTLTWNALSGDQSDVSDQGYLFSTIIIFLGNAGVLLIGIPLLAAKVNVWSAISWWFQETTDVWVRLVKSLRG
jgi:hypothetical protein